MGFQNCIRVASRLPLVRGPGALRDYIKGHMIWLVVKGGGGEKGDYGLRNVSPKGRPQISNKKGHCREQESPTRQS